MSNSGIALQLYTLRDFMKTPAEVASTLRKVREIGYEVVELAGYRGCAPEELKKILNGEGIMVCSMHSSFEAMRDEPQKAIDEHQMLGCQYMVSGSPGEYHSREGFKKFAKDASEVAKNLSAGGPKYAYHNHSFELEKFGDRTGLAILYEESDSQYLKAQIDVYWIQHGGGDPIAWIRKLAGRVPMLHMKDMAMRGHDQLFAEVGEGNLNWIGILQAAKQAGVEWYIAEQDRCERDPFESVAISLQNMRAMGIE